LDQVVEVHAMSCGHVDHGELVTEHCRYLHLRRGTRCHRNAVATPNLSRLQRTGFSTAEKHDGSLLAAFTCLANERESSSNDKRNLLPILHRTDTVGRSGTRMNLLLIVLDKGPETEILVVH